MDLNEPAWKTCVLRAFDAVEIHSFSALSWFGRRLEIGVERERAARPHVLRALEELLYFQFYSRGAATMLAPGSATPRSPVANIPFVARLVAANQGRGYWDAGYQLVAVEASQVVVTKGGVTLRVEKERLDVEPWAASPNALLRIWFPNELPSVSPGFYMAAGPPLAAPEAEVIRIYWSTTPEGAPLLCRVMTDALTNLEIAYRFKVLADPRGYERADAAVLFLRRADFDRARAALQAIYAGLPCGSLRPIAPVFTKVLAPGVSLAEAPPGELSFGSHRSRLLADAVLTAHARKLRSATSRVALLERVFAEAGLDAARPFLNPASTDCYASIARTSLRPLPFSAPSRECVPLEVARAIGRRICTRAIWHAGRCSWLGIDADDLSGRTSSALGPSLYAGTAGVALFLVELSARARSGFAAESALGAIRQALATVDAVPKPQRLGLYTGWPGIAMVAARVGTLLEEPTLRAEAVRLVERCAETIQEPHDLDIISGSAGGILALLILDVLLDCKIARDAALRLGTELVLKARVRGTEASWRTVNARGPDLTGFSHGAAGFVFALLELFAATGRPEFRRTAEMALRYERSQFDPAENNWPDFRGRLRRDRSPRNYGSSWCHGAPGIAITRLRAQQVLRSPVCEAEAKTALATTSAAAIRQLGSERASFCLCHGLSGNAEILLLGAKPGDSLAVTDVAARVARFGVETYSGEGRAWPSGVPGGETPSLMLGDAGVGYFYLRLHDINTPSVLAPSPASYRMEQFSA